MGKLNPLCGRLLTGERPDLCEIFPELAILRDASFLLRLLLAPAAVLSECTKGAGNSNSDTGLPPLSLSAADAELFWRFNPETTKFEVHG